MVALRIAAALLFAFGVWDLVDGGLLMFPGYIGGERAACAAAHDYAAHGGAPTDEDCGPPSPVHGVAWLVASGVVLLFAQTLRPRVAVAAPPSPSLAPSSEP